MADKEEKYIWTLNDISRELGCKGKSDARRNQRIKDAIEDLENRGYISKKISGTGRGLKYKIKISEDKEKNNLIAIQKEWVETISNTLKYKQLGVDWSYSIKIILYLIDDYAIYHDREKVYRYIDIANALNTSTRTISNTINIIQDEFCNFIRTKGIYDVSYYADGGFKFCQRLGTHIEYSAWITTKEEHEKARGWAGGVSCAGGARN